jgi:hypothetical protein
VVDQEASNALAECLARIRQLEEENTHLRQAAKTFGDLAERLKHALDIELGRAADALSDDGDPLSDGNRRTSHVDRAADQSDGLAVGTQPSVRLVK